MKKLKFSLPFPIHPIVISIFPILFLYSHNITELRLNVLWYPLITTILVATLIYAVVFRIYRNYSKSAMLSSLLIIIFFSHGDILNLMFETPFIPKDIVLLGIWIVLLFFVIRFLRKPKIHLLPFNNFLNLVSFLLLIIPLTTIVVTETNRVNLSIHNKVSDTDKNENSKSQPDIYYFIVEEYSSSKVLKEFDNFDNSDIENYLTTKGFYIAKDSTSNYPKTFLSLASSFNYGYLDFLTAKTNGGKSNDQTIVNPLIENNKVVAYFKNEGYKYYHLGSWWPPTSVNHNATKNFVSSNIYLNLDDFTLHLLDTTLLATIISDIFPDEFISSDGYINHRDRTLYEVDRLKNEVTKLAGPKFVFAHLLTPHEPFVFGKDCQKVDQSVVESQPKAQGFTDQINCTNKFIKQIVDSVLVNSKKPPIIIIQADEGELPLKNIPENGENWGKASTKTLKEKFGIFNAYYLPGLAKNPLYPSITPVNSFRVIFDNYFGENLKLLPDKNYIFPDVDNYYKFIDVTEKLK